MVDGIEEFPHIAFQNVALSRIVSTFFPKHVAKGVYAFMCSFAHAARERIGDERRLEHRIDGHHNRMMQDAVSHIRLVDMPTLRV